MPKCRLNWIKPGGFYGVVEHVPPRREATMVPTSRSAGSQGRGNSGAPGWVTSGKWGPFQGRLLHTSYGTCSLYLALVDHQVTYPGRRVRFRSTS